jgi:hypothetical protein
VSVTLDLSASGQGFSRLPEQMGDLLEERSTLMLHERAREELRLISRQFRNLSVPQARGSSRSRTASARRSTTRSIFS